MRFTSCVASTGRDYARDAIVDLVGNPRGKEADKLGAHAKQAPVAQRIEHLTTDQKVGGSNPFGRTTMKTLEALDVVCQVSGCLFTEDTRARFAPSPAPYRASRWP